MKRMGVSMRGRVPGEKSKSLTSSSRSLRATAFGGRGASTKKNSAGHSGGKRRGTSNCLGKGGDLRVVIGLSRWHGGSQADNDGLVF